MAKRKQGYKVLINKFKKLYKEPESRRGVEIQYNVNLLRTFYKMLKDVIIPPKELSRIIKELTDLLVKHQTSSAKTMILRDTIEDFKSRS